MSTHLTKTRKYGFYNGSVLSPTIPTIRNAAKMAYPPRP